jgi:nucleoside-diphosphate-sugar epimerase
MRTLVTGAEGFIGMHLCHQLALNHEVIPIDFKDGDLREPGVAEHLIVKHMPDIVIHLAAQVGIYFNEQDCANSIDANVTMTMRVVQACEKFGIKIIHTSTSEVYGDAGEDMLSENSPLIYKPTGIYALTKRWSEDIVREYSGDWVILRPSMPYGPGAPPGVGRRAMDTMLWQAYHKKPITVHDGAIRSWCYIDDVVKGIELTLNHNGTFNIGRDDDERSMLWIAKEACKLAGAPESLINVVKPPSNKTMVKRLSTDNLRELGWKPTVEIEEGIQRVFEWIKKFPWKE